MDKRVLTVNGDGSAEFSTIGEAMKAAVEGDTILVRRGIYEEKVILDKGVELRGVVDAETETKNTDILIRAGIIATCNTGSVQDLSISQLLDIRQGNLKVARCDIFDGSDGIRICRDCDPTIVDCTIHGASGGTGSGDGIYFQEGAKGTVERCKISNCRVNGIHINGASVTLRNNKIDECSFGIFYRNGGGGVCDRNEVVNVRKFGIYITTGAAPVIENCQVQNADVQGLMLSNRGAGTIQNCSFHKASVHITKGCTAKFLTSNSVEEINGQPQLNDENAPSVPLL